MKVLHVNTNDIDGGAARAAFRIHKGLNDCGVDSKMLVQNKTSFEPKIITPYQSKVEKMYAKIRPQANRILQNLQKNDNPILRSSNFLPSGMHRYINKLDVDIVHLHWINSEMISIKEISKITKPIVWTLHDMWVFSGSEHYVGFSTDDRFIRGYSSKNRPSGNSGFDIDRWTWKRKKKEWTDESIRFNFVAPSRWLARCLQHSDLFKDHKVKVIHNGLDTDIFKPIDKYIARDILNLPRKKKIILYGAINSKQNPIKGYQKLEEAKKSIEESNFGQNLYFIIFGNSYKHTEIDNGIVTDYLGTIKDNVTLSLIYSAADVMVVPSFIEAFGQTASESIACGTPVVAFNTTGLKDIIAHKKTGYLAIPYESDILAKGIIWTIKDDQRLQELSVNCKKRASKMFDIELISRKYIEYYNSIL